MRFSRSVRDIAEFRPQKLSLLSAQEKSELPPNPLIDGAVSVVYMGTSVKRIEGAATGYVYHAAPARRDLAVHPADVAEVLTHRAFVLGY